MFFNDGECCLKHHRKKASVGNYRIPTVFRELIPLQYDVDFRAEICLQKSLYFD